MKYICYGLESGLLHDLEFSVLIIRKKTLPSKVLDTFVASDCCGWCQALGLLGRESNVPRIYSAAQTYRGSYKALVFSPPTACFAVWMRLELSINFI